MIKSFYLIRWLNLQVKYILEASSVSMFMFSFHGISYLSDNLVTIILAIYLCDRLFSLVIYAFIEFFSLLFSIYTIVYCAICCVKMSET